MPVLMVPPAELSTPDESMVRPVPVKLTMAAFEPTLSDEVAIKAPVVIVFLEKRPLEKVEVEVFEVTLSAVISVPCREVEVPEVRLVRPPADIVMPEVERIPAEESAPVSTVEVPVTVEMRLPPVILSPFADDTPLVATPPLNVEVAVEVAILIRPAMVVEALSESMMKMGLAEVEVAMVKAYLVFEGMVVVAARL